MTVWRTPSRRARSVAIAWLLGAAALPATSGDVAEPPALNASEAAQGQLQPRALTDNELCVEFGAALRGESTLEVDPLRREVNRRNLRVDDARAKAFKLAMGASDCHVLAAWGPPSRIDRTVTARGVVLQFVYETGSAFTQNGKVTAWADDD